MQAHNEGTMAPSHVRVGDRAEVTRYARAVHRAGEAGLRVSDDGYVHYSYRVADGNKMKEALKGDNVYVYTRPDSDELVKLSLATIYTIPFEDAYFYVANPCGRLDGCSEQNALETYNNGVFEHTALSQMIQGANYESYLEENGVGVGVDEEGKVPTYIIQDGQKFAKAVEDGNLCLKSHDAGLVAATPYTIVPFGNREFCLQGEHGTFFVPVAKFPSWRAFSSTVSVLRVCGVISQEQWFESAIGGV